MTLDTDTKCSESRTHARTRTLSASASLSLPPCLPLSLVRPEAVLPDRALCLPTLSHFLIVNKTGLALSLSLFLSLSLVESVGFVKSTDRTWKGKKKNKSTVCSKDSSFSPSISPSSTPSYSPPPPHHASPSSQSPPPLPRLLMYLLLHHLMDYVGLNYFSN